MADVRPFRVAVPDAELDDDDLRPDRWIVALEVIRPDRPPIRPQGAKGSGDANADPARLASSLMGEPLPHGAVRMIASMMLAGIRVSSELVRELAAIVDEPTASLLEHALEVEAVVLALSIDDRVRKSV